MNNFLVCNKRLTTKIFIGGWLIGIIIGVVLDNTPYTIACSTMVFYNILGVE